MHSNHLSASGHNHRKSGITTVEQVEAVLEQFMEYHACFLWDRAKDFMETERDLFRSTHHNHASSILFLMMNALIQLAHADKNYLTLQFFSSKVFQRKDSLKSSYEHLKAEFQQLEERGFLLSKALSEKCQNSLPPTPSHKPSHSIFGHCSSTVVDNLESETAQDALDIDSVYQQPQSQIARVETPTETMKLQSPTNAIEADLNVSRSQNKGLFSKFFRFSSRNSISNNQTAGSFKTNQDSTSSVANSVENSSWLESPVVGSGTQDFSNFCMDSLDRLAAHLCGQLTKYAKARIEMIDIYEKLSTSCTSKKFCQIDEHLQTLFETHRNADKSFHHPVLNLLKTMFMLECDILLNLCRVHSSIQNWNFLDSLFGLQDAHNKLNAIANTRDNLLNGVNSNSSSTSAFSSFMKSPNPTLPIASSGAGVNFLRRNFTSSSLSSSGSSNLSISAIQANSPLGLAGSGNPSPNFQLASASFVYPYSASGIASSNTLTVGRVFQRSTTTATTTNFNSSNMPLLIQWLNRFKLFLLSKYSLYFHSLLKIHLTPLSIMSSGSSTSNNSSSANYAHTESQMRQLCAKHLYDFHSRIVQFIRKFDSSYAIIIFDSHSRSHFSFTGYRSPYIKKELPKGINSLPIIYSFPGEFPKNRIPALIMIMNEKMKELNSTDMVVVEYDKPSSLASLNQSEVGQVSPETTASVASVSTLMNRSSINGNSSSQSNASLNLSHSMPNASYFLVRPDPDFTLAIVIESKRLERDSTQIVTFMQEMGILLKGTKIMTSLRTGNMK